MCVVKFVYLSPCMYILCSAYGMYTQCQKVIIMLSTCNAYIILKVTRETNEPNLSKQFEKVVIISNRGRLISVLHH